MCADADGCVPVCEDRIYHRIRSESRYLGCLGDLLSLSQDYRWAAMGVLI